MEGRQHRRSRFFLEQHQREFLECSGVLERGRRKQLLILSTFAKPSPRDVVARIAGALLSGMLLVGCGSGQQHQPSAPQQARAALTSYVTQVEPVRLAVNRLLDGADPILEGFHDHKVGGAEAARRMNTLERRFAAYTVDIGAIQPATAELRSLHAEYAHTFILEDAYLSALTVGLRQGHLDGLPNTEDVQRDAIIAWRTGLMVLARQAGVHLPADLQIAGRGEIRPSPEGS